MWMLITQICCIVFCEPVSLLHSSRWDKTSDSTQARPPKCKSGQRRTAGWHLKRKAIGTNKRACCRCAEHANYSMLWTTTRTRHHRSCLLLSLSFGVLGAMPFLVSVVFGLTRLQWRMAGYSLGMQLFEPLRESHSHADTT